MSDIEKSFAFLGDNIPSWFRNLVEMEEKIMNLQKEVAKAPASKLPMKRKTGSIESIRDLDNILAAPCSPATPQQQASLVTPKAKPASVASGAASAPCMYRSRHMIMVYYDGQIQKQFETLVRSIGMGRNLLRKGKMAARMEALAELANSDDDESEDDDEDNIMSKIQYRRRTGLSSMPSRPSMRSSPTKPSATPEALFDAVDKALEQAQALCERAAHQSLRDGHCRKELEGMRAYFQEVLNTSTTELARYSARQEKKEDAPTTAPAAVPQPLRVEIEAKQLVAVIQPLPVMPSSKAMDIEIDDDDDDSDEEFRMPPVRLTSRVRA